MEKSERITLNSQAELQMEIEKEVQSLAFLYCTDIKVTDKERNERMNNIEKTKGCVRSEAENRCNAKYRVKGTKDGNIVQASKNTQNRYAKASEVINNIGFVGKDLRAELTKNGEKVKNPHFNKWTMFIAFSGNKIQSYLSDDSMKNIVNGDDDNKEKYHHLFSSSYLSEAQEDFLKPDKKTEKNLKKSKA